MLFLPTTTFTGTGRNKKRYIKPGQRPVFRCLFYCLPVGYYWFVGSIGNRGLLVALAISSRLFTVVFPVVYLLHSIHRRSTPTHPHLILVPPSERICVYGALISFHTSHTLQAHQNYLRYLNWLPME